MKLCEISDRLSSLLDIPAFASADVSLNGLQVGDLDSQVSKVAFAVDANMQTISKAVEEKADLLFVHHGMFWGRPVAVTGVHYDKVRALIDNGLGLFACHLPLDAHLGLGNNAQMAKRLGVADIQPFAMFKGVHVGVKGTLEGPLSVDQIISKLGVRVLPRTTVVGDSHRLVRRIGIVSGDGAFDMYAAMEEGLDALVTGEARYSTYTDCVESGFTMLCLGHYETETFGVKAVMDVVSDMGLDTCFIDMNVGI